MSSIKRRPNGQWRARYRDEAGREHARHFARKTDAQQWLDQVTASVVRGDYVDPKAGKVTLASYAASWEAVQVSSDSTRRVVDNALRLHLLPALGAYPIAAVRTSQIQGFVKALESKGLSPGSVQLIYHVTLQVFAAAVDDRVIQQSPCRKITLPKGHDEEVVIPTLDQVQAMADSIGERWRAVVVTLAGSGLRIGEALGLHVSDVDFLRRTISVERQRMQGGHLGPVKSKSSRRVVPVGRVVVEELAAHLAAFPSDGPLFTDEIGEPLIYRRWRTIWEGAARQAGVDFTAHGLRHFFASALISGGASVKQVQTVLGHSSAMVTLKTYAHLWPGDEDRTRDVMDAALGPLADSLRTGEAVDG
jgi:integrase